MAVGRRTRPGSAGSRRLPVPRGPLASDLVVPHGLARLPAPACGGPAPARSRGGCVCARPCRLLVHPDPPGADPQPRPGSRAGRAQAHADGDDARDPGPQVPPQRGIRHGADQRVLRRQVHGALRRCGHPGDGARRPRHARVGTLLVPRRSGARRPVAQRPASARRLSDGRRPRTTETGAGRVRHAVELQDRGERLHAARRGDPSRRGAAGRRLPARPGHDVERQRPHRGEIVDGVYETLVREGELAAEDCATALHHAVRELRAKPRMPLVGWTPFIHHGP